MWIRSIVCLTPTIYLSVVASKTRNGEGRELDATSESGSDEPISENEDQVAIDDSEDDSTWYLGKAKDEYKRKRGKNMVRRREDEDPVQVCALFVFLSVVYIVCMSVGKRTA